jgi:ankyrin repeat protein
MSTRVEANMPITEKRHETRHKKVRRVRSSPIDLLVWEYTNSLDRAKTIEKLKEAAKHFDVDELNASGLNALQQCALDGNLEGLKLLLSLGADCNKRGRGGWTALHYAASEGYLEIVRYLMRHGANVRIADNNQKFPVEITEDESILKLLVRATILCNGILLAGSTETRQRCKHKESV